MRTQLPKFRGGFLGKLIALSIGISVLAASESALADTDLFDMKWLPPLIEVSFEG